VVTSGTRIVASVSAGEDRPDKAIELGVPSARGFRISGVIPDEGPVGFHVLDDDGRLRIEKFTTTMRTVGRIDVPAGTALTSYDLATLSGRPLGQVSITDEAGAGSRAISAVSRPGTRPFALRVGSCLQWQGYTATRPLYVTQDGGEAVTSVTLSGVRN